MNSFHFITSLPPLSLLLYHLSSLIDGWAYSLSDNDVGRNEGVKDGDEWSMEIDLRSREKEKRTLHWLVNGRLQKVFITGLPDRVEFGV